MEPPDGGRQSQIHRHSDTHTDTARHRERHTHVQRGANRDSDTCRDTQRQRYMQRYTETHIRGIHRKWPTLHTNKKKLPQTVVNLQDSYSEL